MKTQNLILYALILLALWLLFMRKSEGCLPCALAA
jgi:hypothetical protein